MALKTFPFDPAEHLGSIEAQADHLTAVLEASAISYIFESLGVAVRVHGMP